MLIERVQASDCYVLRESILRPGQPKENWTFDLDEDQRSIHLAMMDRGIVVAIVSLLPEQKNDYSWRLRGMAVLQKFRGQGIGKQLVAMLFSMTKGGIWCTARKNIHGFYLSNGFELFDDEFIMNDMPHVYMRRYSLSKIA